MKLSIADAMARVALRVPSLERAVVAACHSPALRRSLKLGAVAVGYTRVLDRAELRVAELGKYRLLVNVAEELGMVPFFFGESCTLWFTSSLLRPKDNCVDAGANMGHYAFFMASKVGPSGRVLAFEANPAFVRILEDAIDLNQCRSTVKVHSEALWEQSGLEMTFHISVNSANSGTSSLINHGTFLRADSRVDVKTITLDDAAKANGIDRFRLVKIDVERAEEFVVKGAQSLLSRHAIDFLIVELVAGAETQRILQQHGYVGWFANTSERRLVPIQEVAEGTFGDFVFASPLLTTELERAAGVRN